MILLTFIQNPTPVLKKENKMRKLDIGTYSLIYSMMAVFVILLALLHDDGYKNIFFSFFAPLKYIENKNVAKIILLVFILVPYVYGANLFSKLLTRWIHQTVEKISQQWEK